MISFYYDFNKAWEVFNETILGMANTARFDNNFGPKRAVFIQQCTSVFHFQSKKIE